MPKDMTYLILREQDTELYFEYCMNHKHILQISFPRSGRHWMRRIISTLIPSLEGFKTEDILTTDMLGYHYVDCHLEGIKYNPDYGKYILMIRDPRDSFLSRANFEIWNYYNHSTDQTRVKERLNKMLDLWSKDYKNYIKTMLNFETLLIQYERFSLYPVQIVSRILKFIEFDFDVQDVYKAVREHDRAKSAPRAPLTPTLFASDIDRYEDHCLKWQRDPLMSEDIIERINNNLSDLMLGLGYTDSGHSRNLLLG